MRRDRLYIGLWLTLGSILACAQEGGDLQARILYAYQAEDVNQLASLTQDLANQVKTGGASAALRYHLAHARYRFGLLATGPRAREASPAFEDCVEQLKAVRAEHEPQEAETLTLQAACYGELAKRTRLGAVLLRSKAAERLDSAFRLEPRNPRVLYFESQAAFAQAKPGSPQRERAFEQLQECAAIFDHTSATRDDLPGWGHAEAYLALGVELRARGDALGARNWIEKSLIVAPDFKAAQRQMAALARR